MNSCSVIPIDNHSHAHRLFVNNVLVFADMWSDLHGLYRALPYFPSNSYISINNRSYVFRGVCIDFEIFYYQLLADQEEKQLAQNRKAKKQL